MNLTKRKTEYTGNDQDTIYADKGLDSERKRIIEVLQHLRRRSSSGLRTTKAKKSDTPKKNADDKDEKEELL